MMRGYAVNRGESVPSLTAVAVPLKDRFSRTIAAVALSAPAERIDRAQIREIVIMLRDCATRIREDLPYTYR